MLNDQGGLPRRGGTRAESKRLHRIQSGRGSRRESKRGNRLNESPEMRST